MNLYYIKFLLKNLGLDPALPLFITASSENKLDASDAEFVDVIHTNALVQGKIERCGHVDFYMNGGILQPGCLQNGESKFKIIIIIYYIIIVTYYFLFIY